MTRKLIFIFFSLGIFVCSVYGQDSPAYKSKWQTKLLVGTNIPITKLLQGTEVDYLLQYDDNSYYWQILSISWFFDKNWGLEFNYQTGTSSRIRDRANNFITKLQSEYSDKYYVSPDTGIYDDFNFFYGDIGRGYLGLIYRFETNKFYVYPKFSIGIISFYTDWGGANLKEKNTNLEYRLNYSSGKSPNDHFTFAPSISFGYKLSKRFYLNADIAFSHYKTNIEFEKVFTNLHTNRKTVEHFFYKRNISTLSLATGLMFVIR
jgi:hypothetical protein